MSFFLVFLQRSVIGLLLYCVSYSVIAQDLSSIGQLARDGAPGLAIRLLDQVQPQADANIDGWLFYERQRIEIMRGWQQWPALIERLTQLPASVPIEFKKWADIELANAYLRLGNGQQARSILRHRLWLPETVLDKQEFSLYRRLLIRSYLVDDNLADAQTAMRRYQQDYGNAGKDWRKLQARVLLRTNRPKQVLRLLGNDENQDNEMLALRLLAELRAQTRAPASVLGAVRDKLQDEKIEPFNKARLARVAAEAAEQIPGRLTLTRYLEQTALLAHDLPANDALFKISGDALWQAYRRYGLEEGNKLQLLKGQDKRWLEEGKQWVEKRPQRARAFFALLILEGRDNVVREQAYDAFLQTLQALPNSGVYLLRKLFLDTKIFPNFASIASKPRYILVDDALSRNDIKLATQLMQGLQTAPEDTDAIEWGLRRARVLILGGKDKAGIQVLQGLLADIAESERLLQDRFIQVLFDLQAINRHSEAIVLFDKLLKKPLEPALHRELLFWQADSYKAQENYTKAAWLYLKSATFLDARGLDPWGQTARFKAAEMLSSAGIIEDARRLYTALLKATAEPSRRAMIEYKLQELWLKSSL